MKFECPVEPFNSLVRDGSAGQILGRILEDLKPEAVYFTAENGKRGGIMVINLNSPSEIPRYAEPFFLNLNATVVFLPCMSADDLKNAGLEDLGQKWG